MIYFETSASGYLQPRFAQRIAAVINAPAKWNTFCWTALANSNEELK